MRSKRKRQTPMNIMAINCGSSSLKCRLIRMPEETLLMRGEAERIGTKTDGPSTLSCTAAGKTHTREYAMPDHAAAFQKVLTLCQEELDFSLDCFAHRYVHPGTVFKKTVLLNKKRLEKLRSTLTYAPLHNPICFSLIEFCFHEFPEKRHTVVFDTSFHASIPEVYATYALPQEMTRHRAYRRVGFHGISHEYVTREACRSLEVPFDRQRIISCHLGSGGSSVCAVQNGRSINSSMGFTPLEGLLMNTRSGDIDMGLLFQVMFAHKFTPDSAEEMLNKKSGVLGVYKSSSDLRDVIHQSAADDIVFQMYVKRVRKYICYYALLLKKADLLIFTDTLGLELSLLRREICRDMESLGIVIDPQKNDAYSGGIARMESDMSETAILAVPTDEEGMIASSAYRRMGYDRDC